MGERVSDDSMLQALKKCSTKYWEEARIVDFSYCDNALLEKLQGTVKFKSHPRIKFSVVCIAFNCFFFKDEIIETY